MRTLTLAQSSTAQSRQVLTERRYILMENEAPSETRMKFQNLEVVEVGARAIAGASARVISFPADKGKVQLPLPRELAALAKKGMVDLVTLSGDSLEGVG